MKNILLAFCLLFGVSEAFSQSVVTLREDFNDNKNEWSAREDETRKLLISDGYYYIDNMKPDVSRLYWIEHMMDASKDYSVEASITQTDGTDDDAFGILWCSDDPDNMVGFLISTNGQAYVYGYEEEEKRVLMPWKEVDGINEMNEVNVLKVVKTERSVKFYVNGEEIFESPQAMVFGYNVGFVTSNYVKLKIDYLEIKQAKKPEIHVAKDIKSGIVRENLGSRVNSRWSEISPTITPDGKTLYFGKFSTDNIGGDSTKEDCWFATKQADGSWSRAMNFGRPINNSGNNNIVGVLPDNNTVLCLNNYTADGEVDGGGFSFAYRTSDGWTIPQNIKFAQYDNASGHVECTLGPSSDVLVMTIQRDTTAGLRDMYVSFKGEDGTWSEPMHTGFTLNSPGDETSPSLAADGRTLYFSTNGRPGYGSNDVYVSRRLDDSWRNWSEPENLGKEINTTNWDAYFAVPASGEYAYLVSNESGEGKSDIFRVKLSGAAKPDPVFLVSGHVYNAKTKEPISANIKYEVLPEGKLAGRATSAPKSGDYKISLPGGKVYGFRAEKEGFYPTSENLDATKLGEYTEMTKDLYLSPIEVGEVVRLNNVFFDFAKATLREESYPELNRIVKFMNDNGSMEIALGGHTDNVGSDAANLKLSEDRIQSVKSYLVAQGIDGDRMSAKGYGKSKPIASNDTEDGKQQNRRVEFTIVKK
jgi:outer membrane protein OmpA-like peptidoglycan-associated protein